LIIDLFIDSIYHSSIRRSGRAQASFSLSSRHQLGMLDQSWRDRDYHCPLSPREVKSEKLHPNPRSLSNI
jgi:hypothetical protein